MDIREINKAIKILRDRKMFCDEDIILGGSECEISIKALEKQIPKKVVKKRIEYSYPNLFGETYNILNLCPNCGGEGSKYNWCGTSFCQFCGQNIDWAEKLEGKNE